MMNRLPHYVPSLSLEAAHAKSSATSLGPLGLGSLGLTKNRIDLKISNLSSDRFKIAAEVIENRELTSWESRRNIHIIVMINGKETHLKVNRNSLVKRLGIDKNDLKNAESYGVAFLSEYVSKKVEAMKSDVTFAQQTLSSLSSINNSLNDVFEQKFTDHLWKQSFIDIEKSYKEINQIMRFIDPPPELLDSLGVAKARELKKIIKENPKVINDFKERYEGIKSNIEENRGDLARWTGLKMEQVRHIALHGSKDDQKLLELYAKCKNDQSWNNAERNEFIGIINKKVIHNHPLPGYLQFFRALRDLIGQKNFTNIMSSELIKNNPMMAFNTFERIGRHVKQKTAHSSCYEKSVKDKRFGWSTDLQGNIFVRHKKGQELCLNDMETYRLASEKGDKERALHTYMVPTKQGGGGHKTLYRLPPKM